MAFKKQRRRDKRKSASNPIKAIRDRRPTIAIAISYITFSNPIKAIRDRRPTIAIVISLICLVLSYPAFVKNRRDNLHSNFLSTKQECLTDKNRVDFEYHKKWKIESESNIDATGIICTLYLKEQGLRNELAPKLIVEKRNVGTTISQSEFVRVAKQDIQKLSSNNAKIIDTKFDPDIIFDNDKGYEIKYLISNSDNEILKKLEVGKLDNGPG